MCDTLGRRQSRRHIEREQIGDEVLGFGRDGFEFDAVKVPDAFLNVALRLVVVFAKEGRETRQPGQNQLKTSVQATRLTNYNTGPQLTTCRCRTRPGHNLAFREPCIHACRTLYAQP